MVSTSPDGGITTNTYYFRGGVTGGTVSMSSDGTMLIARDYLMTFNWPIGNVLGVWENGVQTPLSQMPHDSIVGGFPTLNSIAAGGNGCPVEVQVCSMCPDCVGAPGNPDGCQYGEDPIVGGCIGQASIYICINLNSFTAYDCASGDPGSFAYGGPVQVRQYYCELPGFTYWWSIPGRYTIMDNTAWSRTATKYSGGYFDVTGFVSVAPPIPIGNALVAKLLFGTQLHTQDVPSTALSQFIDNQGNVVNKGICEGTATPVNSLFGPP